MDRISELNGSLPQQNGKHGVHSSGEHLKNHVHKRNGKSHVLANGSVNEGAEHENSLSESFDLRSIEMSVDHSDSNNPSCINNIQSAVVFITGGASGLGEATAKRFARLGAKVSILDIKPSAEKLVAEIGTDRCLFTQGDITNDEEVSAAVKNTMDSFGRINLNVNCAGIGSHSLLYDAKKDKMHSEKSFSHVIKTNLIGTFNAMRHCSKAMAQNGGNAYTCSGGVIVNTGSISGSEGQSGQLAYSASKGGLESMTLPAARDLAPLGIRVVAISPGFFDTPLLRTAPEAAVSHIAKTLPVCPKRLGKPEEYAHLVQSIFENPMVNGTVLRLDSATRLPPSLF